MVSKHGQPLLPEAAVRAVGELLLPRAALVTPNLPEAEALTGHRHPRHRGYAPRRPPHLRNGGARRADQRRPPGGATPSTCSCDGADWREFPAPRIATRHTHGTGCTYSAAITAGLARGLALGDAVARAKRFIHAAIHTNPGLGHGSGPVNHHAEVL